MNISCVLNYVVTDPTAYYYSAQYPDRFINNQAKEVIRRVAGLFPFRSNDENAPCLMRNQKQIGIELANLL